MAQGYWNRPEETRETFAARLVGGDGTPFLRTGDLGFLHAGELYITGRLKDLIIIRGRNLYPQDLERTAERSHPSLEAGCGVACSVPVEGEERLVLIHEVTMRRPPDVAEVVGALLAAVADEHEVEVHAVAAGQERDGTQDLQRQGAAPRLPRRLPGRGTRTGGRMAGVGRRDDSSRRLDARGRCWPRSRRSARLFWSPISGTGWPAPYGSRPHGSTPGNP